MCKFNEAWKGICKGTNVKGEDYCEKHLGTKCSICGKQSTHNCAETMQFVCGADLCDSLECKLEHLYKTHGYAFSEIAHLEEELGKTSKIVVSKLGFKESTKFSDWYDSKYKGELQVARLVYSNNGKINVYDNNYRYMPKDKYDIPQLFKGTFYGEELKKKGVFFTDKTLYFDKEYIVDELPELEVIELD